MLRITVQETPRALTFELDESALAESPRHLEIRWRHSVADSPRPILWADWAGVTFIDAAGKGHQLATRRDGAKFIAVDCLMNAVCAEFHGDVKVQP